MNIRLTILLSLLFIPFAHSIDKIDVLIVDGRSNHNWRVTTDSIRATLDSSGRFNVSISTAPDSNTPEQPRRPKSDDPEVLEQFENASNAFKQKISSARSRATKLWDAWNPEFKKYDCVVLNYNGQNWPEPVQKSFMEYVRGGGSVLLIHSANNAFPFWDDFNQMIGLGWRKAPYGKALKWDDQTGKSYIDSQAGNSAHGAKHPFQITIRDSIHPIMSGLPKVWLHARDELYHHMRGPAENLKILSTAWSDPSQRGTGKHEPITWEVDFGKGKAIVTSMGHFYRGERTWDALYCVGFQTIIARSCEYLATGKVTLEPPVQFPTDTETSILNPYQVSWNKGITESNSKLKAEVIEKKTKNPYVVLSPEEELQTFELAPGYVPELVVAEPLVEEPVLTVWDGNGAMYVAEMRSYMQDENGTGTKELRNGRVKRLLDTDGDGVMDKVTTFVDGLNLPRMILPLDDWIAIRESDTMDVLAYRDTNGDGVADEKKFLFQYGPRSRNSPEKSVEHQDSGLIWNVDNWIYISYNMERYRYTDGKWRPQPQPDHWTQWGLTHDNLGRLFWIHNSGPLVSAQLHPKYWYTVRRLAKNRLSGLPITLGDPYAPEFMNVKSLCLWNDRGGKAPEIRAFTSACGQSIFRGHKFPYDDRGRYFFVDPTIHVVRRSNVTRDRGKIVLTKTESGDGEFLRSSDINSRFVNTATAPDGSLYVTDMYRGIIQDAPWMNPQAREFTRRSGLNKNKMNGRIWRIRHKDFEPGPTPNMLDESTVELVRHLHHPNGWWRDTAQKLIILREDRASIVPLLKSTFRYTRNTLARFHALWTLEGMGSVTSDLLSEALKDKESMIRIAGIQIAESIGQDGIDILVNHLNENDPRVAEQLIYSLGTFDGNAPETSIQNLAREHVSDRGVMMSTAISLWGKKHLDLPKSIRDESLFHDVGNKDKLEIVSEWKAAFSNWDRGLNLPKDMPDTWKRQIVGGEKQYYQYCVTCHGSDGMGMKIAGTGQALAPPLAGNPRVSGPAKQLIPIFINGLTGPINGENFAGAYMAPASALGIQRDDRLSEIISYIRYAWGNSSEPVFKDDVTSVRKQYSDRQKPWSDADLNDLK